MKQARNYINGNHALKHKTMNTFTTPISVSALSVDDFCLIDADNKMLLLCDSDMLEEIAEAVNQRDTLLSLIGECKAVIEQYQDHFTEGGAARAHIEKVMIRLEKLGGKS